MNKKYKQSFGFTLAETLITLTIIGIIAALTIPVLNAKYQKHVFAAALKKNYSNLTNAIQMMPISANCPAGDFECIGILEGKDLTIDGTTYNYYDLLMYFLSKNLKTVKVTYYKGFNNPLFSKHPSLDWRINGDGCAYAFLDDGSIIASQFGYIYLDVNGLKGPNKEGRDFFSFTVSDGTNNIPKGTLMPAGSMLYAKYNGCSGDFSGCQYYWKSRCNTYNPSDAFTCAGRVLEEGAMNY